MRINKNKSAKFLLRSKNDEIRNNYVVVLYRKREQLLTLGTTFYSMSIINEGNDCSQHIHLDMMTE